jgi:hypothetical protein
VSHLNKVRVPCARVTSSFTPLLLPSCKAVVGRITNTPLTLGEPAIILWLLVKGAKDQPLIVAA